MLSLIGLTFSCTFASRACLGACRRAVNIRAHLLLLHWQFQNRAQAQAVQHSATIAPITGTPGWNSHDNVHRPSHKCVKPHPAPATGNSMQILSGHRWPAPAACSNRQRQNKAGIAVSAATQSPPPLPRRASTTAAAGYLPTPPPKPRLCGGHDHRATGAARRPSAVLAGWHAPCARQHPGALDSQQSARGGRRRRAYFSAFSSTLDVPLRRPVRRAAMSPTFWPGGASRRTVDACPMCWWLPPPCGCSTGFIATPRTCARRTHARQRQSPFSECCKTYCSHVRASCPPSMGKRK